MCVFLFRVILSFLVINIDEETPQLLDPFPSETIGFPRLWME